MLRILLLCIGWLSLGLGVIGIVLPLLPTTPFVLLSCVCFSKASKHFESWLLNHRYFGTIITNWRSHRVIPSRAKWLAGAMLTFSAITLIFVEMPWIGRVMTWCMLAGVFIFIMTRRSKIAQPE
ncbi:YbaN family protein [Celerinatantimonas sp. MCCC 1A17872]|uniref:YbaN family protein n=1 Tax=Celerinatantimonas sp. MCCC 1A17872 TaxID=3177514 RepID=UPI0038CA37AD